METKNWTIDDIKTANRVRGFHFFDANTMRFFNSRILSKVYQGKGGIYFVTSEKAPYATERLFTVRQFRPESGDIKTCGFFQQHKTSIGAQEVAKMAAAFTDSLEEAR